MKITFLLVRQSMPGEPVEELMRYESGDGKTERDLERAFMLVKQQLADTNLIVLKGRESVTVYYRRARLATKVRDTVGKTFVSVIGQI
jgi:hypothetical protein